MEQITDLMYPLSFLALDILPKIFEGRECFL